MHLFQLNTEGMVPLEKQWIIGWKQELKLKVTAEKPGTQQKFCEPLIFNCLWQLQSEICYTDCLVNEIVRK